MKHAAEAIAIGRLVLALGRQDRATRHEDGLRPETVTDHTVMLGVIACAACPADLDRGRVAEFALVHDLVEARCGDTNTFAIDAEARAAKEERERIAMASIRQEFGAEGWMVAAIDAYERQQEPEARYVRFMDKAMPKVTHALNACAAIRAMGHSRGSLEAVHRAQFEELEAQYPDMDPEISGLMWELMAVSACSYREEGR